VTAIKRPLQRLRSIRAADLALLAEAVASLTSASLKVRYLPFRRITRLIERRVISARSRPAQPGRLRWAVEAAARRLPLRTKCIEQALCLQVMLSRRGLASTLHYGIRRGPDGEISAHVWLTLDGAIVIGGEAAPQFTCVATFETQPAA
jgi:hypothetical protein